MPPNPRRPFTVKRQLSWLPNNARELKITIRCAWVRGDLHTAKVVPHVVRTFHSAQCVRRFDQERRDVFLQAFEHLHKISHLRYFAEIWQNSEQVTQKDIGRKHPWRCRTTANEHNFWRIDFRIPWRH